MKTTIISFQTGKIYFVFYDEGIINTQYDL